LRLDSVTKIACFAQIGQFLNFFSFPSNFCDCSLSSPFTLSLKLTVLLLKNIHFCFISSSNLQGKGMGFLFLTSYLLIMVLVSCFVSYFCDLSNIVFEHGFGLFH